MKPLTDAQIRALEQIKGNPCWSVPSEIYRELLANDLIEERMVLTDSGHAALQEARG